MDYKISFMLKYFPHLLLLLQFLLPSCSHQADQALIGAKIYEHEGFYELLFKQWNRMGINTGFCSESLISEPDKADLFKDIITSR